MQFIQPQVFHIASTQILQEDLGEYLREIGVPEWNTNTDNAAEKLSEIAGRLCYRSFAPGLNANVTKVREGNQEYLANILKSKHGSVLEHGSDTYILHNVSRVVTHELVRHRAGCSYSQESLRYVRLDELKTSFPAILANLPVKHFSESNSYNIKPVRYDLLWEMWKSTFEKLESIQKELAEYFDLDNLPFDLKKKLTSAMRRLAPLGLATDIMITANHRAWRHLIQLRTSRHAEEEIRQVFSQIYGEQAARYPNIYQDAKYEPVDGILEVTFENEKI